MPTLIWNEDFESGTVASIFNANGGAPVLDNTLAFTGAQSFKTSGSSASYGRRDWTAGAITVMRCYIRLASIPSQGVEIFTLNGGPRFGIDNATKKFGWTWGTSQTMEVLSGVTPNAGQWYRLDLRLNQTANPWVLDYQIDGVAQTQVTNAVAASTVSGVYLGHTTGFSVSVTLNFDTAAASQTSADYPLGPPYTLYPRTASDTVLTVTDTLRPVARRVVTDIGMSRVLGTLPLSNDGLTGPLGSNWSGAAYGLLYGGAIKRSGFTSADQWSNAGAAYTATHVVTSDWEVTATLGGSDYTVLGDTGWSNGDDVRLFFTDDTAGTNGYELRFVQNSTWSDVTLYRRTSGSRTTAQTGTGPSFNGGDLICLRKVGSNVTAWHKPFGGSWATLFTYADASPYNGNGYGGLWVMDQHHRVDDFGVGSLTINESFPAAAVLDNFNRTENPLSQSGVWSTTTYDGTANGLKTDGAKALAINASAGSAIRASAPGADQEAFATYPGSNETQLLLRLQNVGGASANGYLLIFGATYVYLYWFTNNWAQSGEVGHLDPTTIAANDVIGARIVGPSIRVYKNGTQIASFSDSHVPSGTIGAGVKYNGSLDNFGGGTYTVVLPRTQTGVSDDFGRGSVSGRDIRFVNDLVIQGLTFKDTSEWALFIASCQNVTIRDCDFDSCFSGINFDSCTGTLCIERCRFHNLTASSFASAIAIRFSAMEGWIRECESDGGVGTEDIISLYATHGLNASHELVVEDCRLSNGVFTSSSNSGVDVGDGPNGDLGSQYVRVRRNKIVTAGQVGLGVAGGRDIYLEDNLVYGDLSGQPGPWGAQYSAGISAANWTETASPGPVHIYRNRVYWRYKDGTEKDLLDGSTVTGWAWSLSMGTLDLSANTMPDTSLAPGPLLPKIPLAAGSIKKVAPRTLTDVGLGTVTDSIARTFTPYPGTVFNRTAGPDTGIAFTSDTLARTLRRSRVLADQGVTIAPALVRGFTRQTRLLADTGAAVTESLGRDFVPIIPVQPPLRRRVGMTIVGEREFSDLFK